jgi:hypothetical protein
LYKKASQNISARSSGFGYGFLGVRIRVEFRYKIKRVEIDIEATNIPEGRRSCSRAIHYFGLKKLTINSTKVCIVEDICEHLLSAYRNLIKFCICVQKEVSNLIFVIYCSLQT